MGILYVVATPIGNLEDMSPRAVRVLREVSLIAAEDTRHTRRLLSHFAIQTPMISYHEHNERGRADRLLGALAEGDVALVSDAGTPAISDPGADLVAVALAAGHTVTPVPGPSAVTAAVAASGLVSGPFVSLGFLPRKGAERRQLVGRAAAAGFPIVFFESPNRLVATLGDLARSWGDRRAVVLRELTKLHEEVVPGTLSELARRYAARTPRGEVVVVVAGQEPATDSESGDVGVILRQLRRAGLSASQAAREAAVMTGLPRSELYALAQRLRDDLGSEDGGDVTPAGSPVSGDAPRSTAESPPRSGMPRARKDPG